MTKDQIIARLNEMGKSDVASRIDAVYIEHKDTVLQQMEYWHRIEKVPHIDYEAYCYLWQNLVERFGNDLISYQL